MDILREKLRKLTLPAEIALNSAVYGPRPGDDNFSCKPLEWLQPRPWCHSCLCDEEGKMGKHKIKYNIIFEIQLSYEQKNNK